MLREKKAIVNAPFTGKEVKETTPGIIIGNVKDDLAVRANIIDAAESDVAWFACGPILVFTTQIHLYEQANALIGRRGEVCVGSPGSDLRILKLSANSSCGEDIRHVKPVGGA